MAIYSEFSHKKWWFSIVMLVYQRVDFIIFPSYSHHIPTIYTWYSHHIPIAKGSLEVYTSVLQSFESHCNVCQQHWLSQQWLSLQLSHCNDCKLHWLSQRWLSLHVTAMMDTSVIVTAMNCHCNEHDDCLCNECHYSDCNLKFRFLKEVSHESLIFTS